MAQYRYKWAASAAKHGITKPRISYVVEHCGLPFVLPPEPPDRPYERLLFLGDDHVGVPLEVMAVELLDDNLYVIHAMELRPQYNKRYKEARLWRI